VELTSIDPDVAAATFARDLAHLWASGWPERYGWQRTHIDDLTEIIEMPARLRESTRDPYYLKLHASHYDAHPVQVTFVEHVTWTTAAGDSRWFPRLENVPSWFGLHATYDYQDGSKRQLICFSFNLDFYLSNHSATDTQVWRQGRHTVAATLHRLHEILGPQHYRGPAAQLEQAA
jgi:hypothetical protein